MAGAARVLGTGVRIERHPDPEPEVHKLGEHRAAVGDDAGELQAGLEAHRRGEAVYVRAYAFVDVELDGARHRWEWTPSPPAPIPLGRPATSELVELAGEIEAGTKGALLADARVAGLRVRQWDVDAAPRRIELEPSLAEALVLD